MFDGIEPRAASLIEIDLQQGPLAAVWRRDPCAALYELAARCPGLPAVLRVGNEEIMLFQDAGAARHIARTRPDNFHKNFGSFSQYFGQSRLTSDGDRWVKLQQLSQPFISATDPAKVVGSAIQHFGRAIDHMLGAAPNGNLVIDPFLDRAAASVIAEVTLGFGSGELGPTMLEDIHTILRYASFVTWNLPGAPQLDDTAMRAAATGAQARLRQGFEQFLQRRVAAAPLASDLLQALIDAADDEVDIFGEVCTLVFAGSDTSAAALGWCVMLLSTAPKLQERLRAEIRAACGDDAPTLADLDAMPELAAFESEALRIFPPIPMLSRVAVDADEISGIGIAKGQKVLLSVIGLHHDRQIFPDSRRVSLDRFPQGQPRPEYLGHYLPFGMGRRACGGSRIASVEVTTALALLIARLDITTADTGPLTFEWLASLRRKGGQRLGLKAVN